MDADANANANAGGSTIALRELRSGELMKFRHCLFKILKNQNVAEGQTDGLTNGKRENSIPPTNTVCRGYKNIL